MAIGDEVRDPDDPLRRVYVIVWDGSKGSPSLSGDMPKRPDYELLRLSIPHGRDKRHGGERIFHL